MSHPPGALPARRNRKLLLPTVTLARWRLRQTWGLLLVIGVGIVAAVLLVCAVPLYSEVEMSAGLRNALTAMPQNGDITIQGSAENISSAVLNQATQRFDQELQQHLGAYLGPSQFSLQTSILPVLSNRPDDTGSFYAGDDQVVLTGASIDMAGSHLHILQGQLPATNGNGIQVAISAESAARLKVQVGAVIRTKIAFVHIPEKRLEQTLSLQIVGIFQQPPGNDSFWRGNTFTSASRGIGRRGGSYDLLVSNDMLASAINTVASDPAFKGLTLESPISLFWSYHLDPFRLDINHLGDILTGTAIVQSDLTNHADFNQPPYVEKAMIVTPSAFLGQYHDRIAVAQIPVFSLLVIIVALILFFVSMMTNLLVERQAETIAVLRSRGASRWQIFGSLLTQGLGLAGIALVVGPLLTLVVVYFFVQQNLSSADSSALSLITNNPIQVAFGLWPYALITAGIAVLAMAFSILRATSTDVLTIRREAARSTRQPLWLRLNLDIVAAIIALLGYGFSLYLTNSGVLDLQTRLLLLTPLTLLGTICVLIACLLLFLRLFPLLLQGAAWLATRRRGAAPLLALAQMARAPGQSVRMTLLLALATAFAIFTLVFTASQSQRILDVAAYQSAADFSGTLLGPVDKQLTVKQLASQTAAYTHISGVFSATLGYTSIVDKDQNTFQLIAVDATTFASTAIWPREDATQPLKTLMTRLSSQRNAAIAGAQVPAIVDEATWNALNLSNSPTFLLPFTDGTITFIAIAKVPYLPPVNDKGILVDYTSFAQVYSAVSQNPNGFIPLNSLWLSTKDDATSLASVRSLLSTCCLGVSPLIDRRALISSLQQEPLYLDLIGILTLGAATALLLALLGNLLSSWLNARSRLINFAILRALGAASRHVASVLTWEQSLIYSMAIVLGLIFGALLSALVVPVLIFTNVATSGGTGNVSSGDFYLLQRVPPTQIVLPPTLGLVLGVLIAICILALTMMVRIVSQPSISQTLRLNED